MLTIKFRDCNIMVYSMKDGYSFGFATLLILVCFTNLISLNSLKIIFIKPSK